MSDRFHPYKVHPFADKFPLLDEAEFQKLVKDIRGHGLRQPIVLAPDGETIVDGRNRYLACVEARILARFETFEGASESSILSYIVSANLRRRHLTTGQLAMFALEFERRYAEEAAKRRAQAPGQPRGVKSVVADLPQQTERSRDLAAREFGISPRAVQQAKAVELQAPDLAQQVSAGDLSLHAADAERRQRLEPLPNRSPRGEDSAVNRIIAEIRKLPHTDQRVIFDILCSQLADFRAVSLSDGGAAIEMVLPRTRFARPVEWTPSEFEEWDFEKLLPD